MKTEKRYDHRAGHRFEQCGRVIGCQDLALGEFAACLETIVADSPLALPINHIV